MSDWNATAPASGWRLAIVSGAILGAAYALSPLTVLVLAILPFVWRRVSRDLSPPERRWLGLVLAAAVALRLAAIAGLFVTAAPSVPFASFFGDEEFFKRRSIWMRNIGLGVPVARSDIIYAYDDVGRSLHLYVLAFFQAVFGDAPYGIPLLDAFLYVAGALALYRVVRPAFGGVSALGGVTLLLFLPSLFTWSVSALKEPTYICAGAIQVVAAVWIVRARTLGGCFAALLLVAGCVVVAQALRDGGLAMALGGVCGGFALAFVVARPRVLLATLVVVPLAVVIAFNRPAVQVRAWSAIHQAAGKHWGHISTPGYTYKLLEPQFYSDLSSVRLMTPPDAERFVMRAATAYLVEPLPHQIESRTALAYIPEQIVWYLLVVLAPIGVVAGLRRDALITSLLTAHALSAALLVALTGGNVGTLVRHRGLALPYLVWLSAFGAVHACAALLERSRAVAATGSLS